MVIYATCEKIIYKLKKEGTGCIKGYPSVNKPAEDMKKVFLAVSAAIISLTSCTTGTPEAVQDKEVRESVVHRVYKAHGGSVGHYFVRLEDGSILKKTLAVYHGIPDDFFFLREGDTVVYSGSEVLEIRFKDEQ